MAVRVATYNLYLGADLSGLLGDRGAAATPTGQEELARQLRVTAFPRRAPAIARLLAQKAPDLVGLQEVCVWSVDGTPRWDYLDLLLTALEDRGSPYEPVASVCTFHGEGELDAEDAPMRLGLSLSNVILRRTGSSVRVTGRRRGTFRAALSTPLLGPIRRGWCEVTATAGPGGDPLFSVVCTHTEAHDTRARDAQRDELLAVLPPGPLVVLGDLNAPPDQVGMAAGRLTDAWLDAGKPDAGPEASTSAQDPDLTNPRSTLSERIDYVWVRGVQVRAACRFGAEAGDRIDGTWPSDHAGLCVELS